MKLVCVNLPAPFLENQKWVYPTGLLSIATYAMKVLGHDVEMLDLAGKSVREFDDAIMNAEAEILLVSAVTPQAWYLRRLAALDRRTKLIAGGVHASLFPQQVQDMGYDSVVVGEGETALARAIYGVGIFHGRIMEDLDMLPIMSRGLFKNYAGPAPMMAGRGCPFACAFCAQIVRNTRFRDPQAVAEELALLPQEDVVFYDDTLTLRTSWLCDFRTAVKRLGIRKRLRCSTRADRLTSQTASLLADSGFVEICLGVESGDQGILDTIKKRTTVAQNTEAVRVCRAAGLRSKAFIMLGLPGETRETIQATQDWVSSARPDRISVYIFNPLPGCDIYDYPESYDIGFSKQDFARQYYGGDRNAIESQVHTRALSADSITTAYRQFLQDFSAIVA